VIAPPPAMVSELRDVRAVALRHWWSGARCSPGEPVPHPSAEPCTRFPSHGSPMVFYAWLRCLRIANGASQSVQAQVVEPVLGSALGSTSVEVAAMAFLGSAGADSPRSRPSAGTCLDSTMSIASATRSSGMTSAARRPIRSSPLGATLVVAIPRSCSRALQPARTRGIRRVADRMRSRELLSRLG
jgi:hypothetical protein